MARRSGNRSRLPRRNNVIAIGIWSAKTTRARPRRRNRVRARRADGRVAGASRRDGRSWLTAAARLTVVQGTGPKTTDRNGATTGTLAMDAQVPFGVFFPATQGVDNLKLVVCPASQSAARGWLRRERRNASGSANVNRVCVEANFTSLYDQAGVMLLVDEKHWIKSGIEYNDGQPMIGSVLTNQFSDWATEGQLKQLSLCRYDVIVMPTDDARRSFVFRDLPFLVAGTGRRTYDASCPDVFSSGIRPRRPSGDGPLSGVQSVKFPESAGDPEELTVDSPSSSSSVTAGSGSDDEVVGRRSVRTGETR
ncbi:Regulation of enolase protein 1 [Eumeta japonica]|uniref:Regulation of enolase protein 1 n=1 Tax=Eumeta variegata TaxID=151549 RepID=A0A4C1SYY0_EUMVA|nr:Regulation of enolase protein 1 [Eumeta japonica]